MGKAHNAQSPQNHPYTLPPTQTLNYFATLLQPRTSALLCTESDSAVWRKTVKTFRDSIVFWGEVRVVAAWINSALTAQRLHAQRTCLGNHHIKACISRVWGVFSRVEMRMARRRRGGVGMVALWLASRSGAEVLICQQIARLAADKKWPSKQ